MAADGIFVYINDELLASVPVDSNYSVTSTGLEIMKGTVTKAWTYSGSNQFLGFSKTQGATTAEYGVGSIGILSDMQPTHGTLYLYSVEVAIPAGATYYKTSSDELTSIADAIRSKAGTSNSLEFPTGFVNAITNL